MDIITLCPLRVAPLLWQSSGGSWTLTIVCKATYRLAPEVSPLHEEQELPNEEDSYWDDNPNRSLSSSSDLVPFKARADVLLVGYAFAPGKQAARSLVARMIVGEIDKSIEVFCKRVWAHDGQLREGPAFESMRFAYEHAAGGPDTWNPVGLRCDAPPDAHGSVAIPRLQPPGMTLARRADFVPPVGFGPIAPAWALRTERLGRHRGSFFAAGWRERPVPEDLEPAYFNVAPRDQQVDTIRSDERIVLENLHPQHSRLVTSLPGMRPRVFAERQGEPPQEVAVRCDTLSIDTGRGICTLVWRGHVPVAGRTQRGRVLVGMEERGKRVGWGELERMVGRESGGEEEEEALDAVKTAPIGVADGTGTETQAIGPEMLQKAATPFRERVGGSREEPSPGVRIRDGALPFVPALPGVPPGPSPVASPWVERQSADVGPGVGRIVPPSPEVPWPAPVVPPPSPIVPCAGAAAREGAPAKHGQKIGVWRSASSSPAVGEVFDALDHRGPRGKESAFRGVLAASNAAADPVVSREKAATPAPTPVSRGRQPEAMELIWFDPKVLPRMRKQAAWKGILAELRESKPKARDEDGDEASRDKRQEAKDRREVAAIMRRGDPFDAAGVEAALAEMVDDETFTPPLVLVAGELELPFDEFEVLKATLVAIAPFVPGDKKLKETVEVLAEVMKTPGIERARGVAEGLVGRALDAFGQIGRGTQAGYLEAQTEQMLLEGRCYQKRAVMGAEWLRGVLRVAGSGEAVIAYLPEAVKNELPMFSRFRVSIVGEGRRRVDQYEVAEVAIKVAAMGRTTVARR